MAKKKRKRKEQGGSGPGDTASRAGVPRPVRLSPRIEILVSLALLLIGLCVLYPEVIFKNEVISAGDVQAAASLARPIKNAIDTEDVYPLWNPYLFAGMPSYGSLAYNPYVYPVTAFTTLLVKYLHFPGMTWLLFHNLMLGIGVWLLLRSFGVHFLIATAAGIVMMWMPNHVAVGAYGHGSQSNAVAYIPFVLYFWDRLWRGKGIVLSASALVILLGFQLLRAHLQISYYTFALIGLHVVFFGFLKVRDGLKGKVSSGNDTTAFPFAERLRRREGGAKAAAFGDLGGLVGVLIVVIVGALLVSAVLFLPVEDYAKYSIRGAAEGGGLDYDYATSWSLHPAETLTFILPSAFGFGKWTYHGHMPFTDYPNYIGVVVVFFAIVAAFMVRTRFVRFLLFVIVVTTLVAFGKYLPLLYDPLFHLVPYFNKFRVPVMILIVQQIATVLLFGFGLSAVIGADPGRGRRWALWTAVGAAGLLIVAGLGYGYWTNGYAEKIAPGIRNVRSVAQQIQLAQRAGEMLGRDLIKMALLLLSSSIVVHLYFRRVMPATACIAVISVLALADVYIVSHAIHHPETMFANEAPIIKSRAERDRFQQPDAVIDFLKQEPEPFRIMPVYHPSAPFAAGVFSTNRYMNFGIASIGGYHAAKLSLYDHFIQALGASLQRGSYDPINMLNVRYIISSNPYPEDSGFPLAWRGKDYSGQERFIYGNPKALPRAFFVDRYQKLESEQILAALASGRGFDASSLVLLEEDPDIRPVSKQGALVTSSRFDFNEIHLQVNLQSAAILVLSEVFYPRWRVAVDGTPANLLRANYLLRAVALPAGDHDVEFWYDTSLLRRALVISVVTVSLAFLTLLVSILFRLKSKLRWTH